MRQAVVLLASLLLVAAPSDGWGSYRTSATPGHAVASPMLPLQRLLIAVPDRSEAVPDGPDAADSAAVVRSLHIADPVASVAAAGAAGDNAQLAAPFWFVRTATPTTGPSVVHATVPITPGVAPADPGQSLQVGVVGGDGLAAASLVVALPVDPGESPDVQLPATDTAGTSGVHVTVVEVLGGSDGIVADRVGDLMVASDELRTPVWRLPQDGIAAVDLDGVWWSLSPGVADLGAASRDATAKQAAARVRKRLHRSPVSSMRRLMDASVGDVTADGVPDLALAFRRPFGRTLLNVSRPRTAWTDRGGLSAHVGLYRPGDLSEIWVAGTLVRPVQRLAACTGALAVAYSTLSQPAIVATSAWGWHVFGFLPLPILPGQGSPICMDVDHDGRLEAAIVERS